MRTHTRQRVLEQGARQSYDEARPPAPLAHWARVVAAAVAPAALMAAVVGLLVDGLYGTDQATAEMLRGFDAVTIPAAVLLAGCVLLWRRGSLRGHLGAASMLTYVVYTYAYHLFGTGFNDVLLLHVAVFSAGLTGLVLTVAAIDSSAVASAFADHAHTRPVAVVLAVLALSLAGMWVFASVDYAVSGDIPVGSSLVESDTVVRLGIVLDLALLVPAYAAAAVLLWRREAWGFVLATLMVISGLLHQLSYLAALVFQSVAEVPEAVAFDPVEPVIVLLYAAAAAALMLPGKGPVITPSARRR